MISTAEQTIRPRDVTFQGSMTTPFQRWYPYIEGYSIRFVQQLIAEYCGSPTLIYEPFAGTGTTLFAADSMGCDTVYSEVNPLLRYLIKVKLTVMGSKREDRMRLSVQLSEMADTILRNLHAYDRDASLQTSYDRVFGKSIYFPDDVYDAVLRLRTVIDRTKEHDQVLADLLSIAVVACLLPVSYLKKQGDVRFKNERERTTMLSVAQVLPAKMREIAHDLTDTAFALHHNHQLATENAKHIGEVETAEITDVITSPPYLNGTNYFRNTKLELWFLRYLQENSDLRRFRDEALTSGINDVVKENRNAHFDYYSPLLEQTLDQLSCHAYDSRIPTMAYSYFNEMYQTFSGLTSHLRPEANILIDIGDSIFSGVHIRTDDILVEVLRSVGYHWKEKRILRQRRSRGGGTLSQVLLVLQYQPSPCRIIRL